MRIADNLVAKAGPGTTSKSLIAGVPMVLSIRLPGQEGGNVASINSTGAGAWAPNPEQISASINHWIQNPEEYARAVSACKSVARPDAARQIEHIQAEPICSLVRI